MAKVTQIRIARKLKLDVSSVNKILNKCQGPVFRKDTVQKVFQIARELGYDFNRIKFRHNRRYPRKDVEIETTFSILRADGSVYDTGTAKIRDVSAGGVRLADISLPLGTLPIEPTTVRLKPSDKPLDSFELTGRVVRIISNGDVSLGVSFSGLESATIRKLQKIAAN